MGGVVDGVSHINRGGETVDGRRGPLCMFDCGWRMRVEQRGMLPARKGDDSTTLLLLSTPVAIVAIVCAHRNVFATPTRQFDRLDPCVCFRLVCVQHIGIGGVYRVPIHVLTIFGVF